MKNSFLLLILISFFALSSKSQIKIVTKHVSKEHADKIEKAVIILNSYLQPKEKSDVKSIAPSDRLSPALVKATNLYKFIDPSITSTALLQDYLESLYTTNREIKFYSSDNSKKPQCYLTNFVGCSDIANRIYGTSNTITFYTRTLDSLNDYQLSTLLLYNVLMQDLPNAKIDDKYIIFDRSIKFIKYEQYGPFMDLSRTIAKIYESCLNKNSDKKTNLILDLEQKHRLVSYKIYDSTLLRDVSTIISGPEGKLAASKIDLKFTSPGLAFSMPVPNFRSNHKFLNIGAGLNFKEEITDVINKKPNFEGFLNLELVGINSDLTKFNFDCADKENYLLNMYSQHRYDSDSQIDSIMMNVNWKSKRIAFYTINGNASLQRLNMLDSNQVINPEEEVDARYKLNGVFSMNLHFYKLNNSKKLFENFGNIYAKAGLNLAFNNNVSNGTTSGIKVEEIEQDSVANKVLKEYVAFNKEDVIKNFFTFNPHLDFYLMENSKHLGIHFKFNYKLVAVNESKLNHFFNYGVGFFGSVRNSLSKEGNVINFELLIQTTNLFNKNSTFNDMIHGFVPSLKMEFPFNQINYKH